MSLFFSFRSGLCLYQKAVWFSPIGHCTQSIWAKLMLLSFYIGFRPLFFNLFSLALYWTKWYQYNTKWMCNVYLDRYAHSWNASLNKHPFGIWPHNFTLFKLHYHWKMLYTFICQRLAGASLLVFANKQDIQGALKPSEIAKVSRFYSSFIIRSIIHSLSYRFFLQHKLRQI